MRDERMQRAGPVPAGQGSRIRTTSCASSSTATTPPMSGAWFFQNGPQRVYVELEAAPFVWRLHARRVARRR